MKVRDIKKYRQIILESSQDIVGSLGNDDPFLLKLDGTNASIVDRIHKMTNFAIKAEEQIFYELLQNAQDSGANTFSCFVDESGIIFLNNGEPFQTAKPIRNNTEPPNPGELIGLLQIGKSAKNEDTTKIGKYGIGFKLIYDLLRNPKLDDKFYVKKLIEENLKGPIIFSWSTLTQLENFLNSEIVTSSESNLEATLPLITKLVLTYFPAEFNEIKKVDKLNSEVNLFSNIELNDFRTTLSKHFNETSRLNFNSSGTCIYLPIAQEMSNSIMSVINDNIIDNLRFSLNFLPQIKSIIINGKVVTRLMSPLVIELDSSENYEFSIQNKKLTKKVLSDFSKDKVLFLSNQIDIPNFYNYFPVFQEKYGFNLIIHSPYFDPGEDRQKIDWSKNQKVLKNIEVELLKEIQKIIDSNEFDKYLLIFKSIISHSENDIFKENAIVGSFYDNLISILKQNIPSVKNICFSFDKVLIKESGLDFHASDFGYDCEWVHPDLKEYFDELQDKLDVKMLNIGECLENEDEDNNRWVNNLSNEDYALLIQEINSLGKLKSLKVIKVSDGSIVKINNIGDENCKIIPLLNSIKELEKLLIKQNISFTDKIFLNDDYKNHFEGIFLDKYKILDRLDKQLSKNDLKPADKWLVFRVFRDNFNFETKDFRQKVKIFKGVKHQFWPLQHYLKSHLNVAPSGILSDFQIDPTEILYNELDEYFMKMDEIWGIINHKQNWDQFFKSNINSESYQLFLNDMDNLYLRGINKEKLSNEIDWILCDDAQLYPPQRVFLNSELKSFEFNEYDSIFNFLKSKTNLKTISKSLYNEVYDVKFATWTDKGLKDLKLCLANDVNITLDELKVLNKLTQSDTSFFTYFFISESDTGIKLGKNDGGIKHFNAKDSKLLEYLMQWNYYPVSIKLTEIFHDDPKLYKENEPFAILLLGEFIENNKWQEGADKAFVSLFSQCSTPTKIRYFSAINRFDIDTTAGTYEKESFESKVIEMIVQTEQVQKFKSKIYIDGQCLDEIKFKNEIQVEYNGKNMPFFLSNLIGYDGADLNAVKNKFKIQPFDIFDGEEYDREELKSEILDSKITCPEQVGFLITQNKFITIDEVDLDEIVLIDYLFEKRFNEANKIFTKFENWIITNDEFLVLEDEKPHEWLINWYGLDEQKKEWLKKNKVRFDDSKTLKLRSNCDHKWDKNDIDSESKFKSHVNNTLEWLSLKESNFNDETIKNINLLIQAYTLKHNELPEFLLTVDLSTGDRILTETEDVEYNQAIWQESFDKVNFDFAKNEIIKKYYIHHWIDFTHIEQKACLDLIDKAAKKIILKDEIDESTFIKTNITEWEYSFYKHWRDKYAPRYKIFDSNSPIQKKLRLKLENEEPWYIQAESGNCELYKVESEYRILIQKQDTDVKKLHLLEQNHHKVFKADQERFIKLLKCFIDEGFNRTIEDDEKLTIARKYTSENLKEIINKGTSGKTGDLNAPDWTDEQKDMFDKLKERLKVLMDDPEAEAKLEDLIKDKNPKPNEISGFMGERIIYYWLDSLYPGQVEDVSAQKLAYDLTLNWGNEIYYIEVKTTIGSIEDEGASIPVFLRKAQREFIRHNQKPYFLINLGLEDIHLKEIYYNYRGKKLSEIDMDSINIILEDWIIRNAMLVKEKQYNIRLTMPERLSNPFD